MTTCMVVIFLKLSIFTRYKDIRRYQGTKPRKRIFLQEKSYDGKLVLVHVFTSKCVMKEQKQGGEKDDGIWVSLKSRRKLNAVKDLEWACQLFALSGGAFVLRKQKWKTLLKLVFVVCVCFFFSHQTGRHFKNENLGWTSTAIS